MELPKLRTCLSVWNDCIVTSNPTTPVCYNNSPKNKNKITKYISNGNRAFGVRGGLFSLYTFNSFWLLGPLGAVEGGSSAAGSRPPRPQPCSGGCGIGRAVQNKHLWALSGQSRWHFQEEVEQWESQSKSSSPGIWEAGSLDQSWWITLSYPWFWWCPGGRWSSSAEGCIHQSSETQPWLPIHLTDELPRQNWNIFQHSSELHEAEKQEAQTASTLAELEESQINTRTLQVSIFYFTYLHSKPLSFLTTIFTEIGKHTFTQMATNTASGWCYLAAISMAQCLANHCQVPDFEGKTRYPLVM